MENKLIEKFIKDFLIEYPNSKIDEGINYIINSFKDEIFCNKKIYNLFEFNENSKYKLKDINLIYILIEFGNYLLKINLDNPHFLNNYFLLNNLYSLYNESTIYLIMMKIGIIFYEKLKKYKSYFEDILYINEYLDEFSNYINITNLSFYKKDISFENKKNIILKEYELNNLKKRNYIYVLFWLIKNDIEKNLLDENILENNNFMKLKEIMNILNNCQLSIDDVNKIDLIQRKHNVIDNYKLFKDIFILNK